MTKFSVVEGNAQWLDGGAMFGNCPRVLWEKWMSPDDQGRVRLACNAFLIEDGRKKILLETGIGAFFEPKLADRFGVENYPNHQLLSSLEALDVSHEDIDYVILSHLHFDHAGGLLSSYNRDHPRPELLFPRAKFVVGRKAYERSKKPHSRDRASFIPELVKLLDESERLIFVESDCCEELGEEFSFVQSDGHTPGQLHTLYSYSSGKVFFAGDLIPGKPWIHLPITMGYDRFPELLIDEKQKVLETATKEDWLLFFTHDPNTPACKIGRNDKGKYMSKEDFSHFTRRAF